MCAWRWIHGPSANPFESGQTMGLTPALNQKAENEGWHAQKQTIHYKLVHETIFDNAHRHNAKTTL